MGRSVARCVNFSQCKDARTNTHKFSISYCNHLFFPKKVYSTYKLNHTIFNLKDAYMARKDQVLFVEKFI